MPELWSDFSDSGLPQAHHIHFQSSFFFCSEVRVFRIKKAHISQRFTEHHAEHATTNNELEMLVSLQQHTVQSEGWNLADFQFQSSYCTSLHRSQLLYDNIAHLIAKSCPSLLLFLMRCWKHLCICSVYAPMYTLSFHIISKRVPYVLQASQDIRKTATSIKSGTCRATGENREVSWRPWPLACDEIEEIMCLKTSSGVRVWGGRVRNGRNEEGGDGGGIWMYLVVVSWSWRLPWSS